MPKSKQQSKFHLERALPLLTIGCLATCAIAGLAVGVYDIAYTSVHFEVPTSTNLVLGR
ncbi:MAG: hypothetical protein AB8B86_05870 [Pseudomonadales bacterium]